MKKYFYNLGYFLKEVKTLLGLNIGPNAVSLFSTALILFILSMIISGWWVTDEIMKAIQDEAEINIYFDENLDKDNIELLMREIMLIEGVKGARYVNGEEAYERMVRILGKEAKVLEYFDDNPFNPFIEVGIDIEEMDFILKELKHVNHIEHIRDNRGVFHRLQNISEISKFLGYLIIIAVSMTTIVIISHIIRLGIHNNREQISTLRLLGAPEAFIAFPFILGGLFLTVSGGVIATCITRFILRNIYAQVSGLLPFIPLPPLGNMLKKSTALVLLSSIVLGFLGSSFGIVSTKNN